ncbi:Sec7 domain protein [Trichuris suis]|nr:Sec7 domain protein [Trichuris suis]
MDAFSAEDLTQDELELLAEIRKRKAELIEEIEQIRGELAEVQLEIEKLELMDEERVNSKAKQMLIGKKKFNVDPKKGIEFLIEHGLLGETPEQVAEFLFKAEGLSKTSIGEYLGERDDFNRSILQKFVFLHDFTSMDLVQALRQLLWSFRLPGEAQKIDRMMECFATRYCAQNSNVFKSPDVCYVVSFSIIMLNTSLHNPSVKDKPTLEQFISMNRDIDEGRDLSRDLLSKFYESIRAEPFKIPEDGGKDLMHTFFNPDREGWLWKQGGRYRSWKRRWFVLSDNCLYYFENTGDKEPRGIIPLENVQVRQVVDRTRAYGFEIYSTNAGLIKACKTDSDGKVIEGKHNSYRMAASSAEERNAWINALDASINCCSPFQDMIQMRKRRVVGDSTAF